MEKRRARVRLAAVAAALLAAGCSGPAPPEPGERLVDEATGLALRFVAPGEFRRGSPADEPGRDDDETAHLVRLTRGVWMTETEITRGQWARFAGTRPALFAACGDDCPVERVSWYDAVAFANRLSIAAGLAPCYALAGCRGSFGGGCPRDQDWCRGDFACREVKLVGPGCEGYRLPTEAEWERAARAGTAGPTWRGAVPVAGLNDAPALDPIAWYGGNSGVEYRPAWDCSDWPERQRRAERCGTHPVGGKAPNPWGLADTLGNVWEWTWDRYGAYPESPAVDPTGAEQGDDRVRRGCSWANIARHCRVADRSADPPQVRDRNWGFRLVRSAMR